MVNAIHVALKTVRYYVAWISTYIHLSKTFSSLFPLSGILSQAVQSPEAPRNLKACRWVVEADMVKSKAGLS